MKEVYMDYSDTIIAGLTVFLYFIYLAVAVVSIAALWKVFTKAGKPGWASIIPIYNMIVLLEITGKPIWWLILYFIPIVNIVITIMVAVELSNKFNKSSGFAVGLILLPFIFYPILGFGSAEYKG